MAARLVALDEGSDIPLDRTMVVVGRHPQCDARLDSLRVSRHHCCMTQDKEEVVVRDLGSTNGIRINGQRVEMGRLRPGDELSIAHIRYRLENGVINPDVTMADPSQTASRLSNSRAMSARDVEPPGNPLAASAAAPPSAASLPLGALPVPNPGDDNPLAAAVRDMLPAGMADKCRIQVIVQMPGEAKGVESQLSEH